MSKHSLDKYLEVLFEINPETNDFELPENEFIRLVAIHSQKPEKCLTRYIKTKKELSEFLKKYKQVFNIYIGLSTTNGQHNTAEYMRNRRVIMLDFDKKDYPDYKSAEDFSAHIKSKLPPIFNHMIVDSGNGYHFYIAINKSVNTERITRINRDLAELVGADIKATLPTQIVRLPASLNLKDIKNKKPVNVVANNLESCPHKFKRYTLQKLERYIEQYQRNKKILEEMSPLPAYTFTKNSSYYCVEAMLAEGAREGERNFCLGRITKYLQIIKGYTESNALKAVLEWNRRCQPPKSSNIVEDDFRRYWKGEYKLLGCNVSDTTDQKTLTRFCDKSLCNSIFEERRNGTVEESEELKFDNKILKNTIMSELTGYHYMILSILDFYKKSMTRQQIIRALTGRKTKKCCISDNTLRKVLNDLIERKYIVYDDYYKYYYLSNEKSYGATYTRYFYAATIQLINRIISAKEYLVYLCLTRNLQHNTNVTYSALAEALHIDESNVGKYIRGLHEAGLITIDIGYNKKGLQYNSYKIVA